MTSHDNRPETDTSNIDPGRRDGHADVLAARTEARRAIIELGRRGGARLRVSPEFRAPRRPSAT